MGESIKEDDDEAQECFRKYKTPLDSYRDHSEFLMNGQRYAFLFDLEPTDYKAWAYGLKKAGYATNPRYPELLITTIEKNNLAQYDLRKVTEKEVKVLAEEKKTWIAQQRNVVVNGVPGIVAKTGESLASIALENEMRVWQLYKYNDLKKDAEAKEGDTIYLKPKNYKCAQPTTHLVKENESMHLIAQRYAIKLSKLLHKNQMLEGDEPMAGEIIYLDDKRAYAPKLVVNKSGMMQDSLYNDEVYEDAKKNIETMMPVMPEDKYAIHIPDNKDDMAFFHNVQAGETLFSIAKKYNVQVEGIKQLNHLHQNTIKTGASLIINPNQPPVTEKEEQAIPGYHVVKQGENWYSIARRYSSSVRQLRALNSGIGDTLRIGDELVVIPMNGEKVSEDDEVIKTDETVYHIVKEHETVYSICRKYNITSEQLRSLNHLLDNTIQVGQHLRIR
jgi:LysM repeat protein